MGIQYPIQNAVDGRLTSSWDLWPEVYQRQVAYFELQPISDNLTESNLVLQLTSAGATLGCFRLSVTSESESFDRVVLRTELSDSEILDVSVALAQTRAALGHMDEAVASFADALNHASDRTGKTRIIATAAALAVGGPEVTTLPLDEAAKAKLRRQVLDWLKAELAICAKAIESTPPEDRLNQERLNVVVALSYWQQDSGLASIRDKSTLAKLPADEQQAFTDLWAAAAELVTKADGGFRSLSAAKQVEEVRKELKKRNPAFDGVFTHTIELGVVTELSITGKNVRDISPVRALTGLKILGCTKCPLSDISPLQGMQLSVLDLTGTQVRDLEPLKYMPLTFLNLMSTPVRDLTPLQGMPLTDLSLWGCNQVDEIAPLKGMKLTRLNLYTCAVNDLSPLQGMPLTYLYLAGCGRVQDVNPLAGMPLTDLNLDNTQIPDLKPLAGMPLVQLSIWRCVKVRDLEPLKGMALNFLALPECNQVKDLSPLKGMPLKRLEIVDTAVTDLRPLQGMSLESIRLSPKKITEHMEVLREMKSLKAVSTDRADDGIPATQFWTRYDKGEFK